MMSRALRVLLVEDDDDDFVLFGAMARSLPGWTLERVATSEQALARLGQAAEAEEPFDACLLDLRLDADDGLEVLCRARRAGYAGPVIVLTGAREREVVARALEAGAADFLVKGAFRADDLERAVRFAVAQHRLALARVARAEAQAAMRAGRAGRDALARAARAAAHDAARDRGARRERARAGGARSREGVARAWPRAAVAHGGGSARCGALGAR
ncbi:MAG: response regulator [Myxococcota bacterium]|nr:response regulator [Myxococcota bacterium]